MSIKLSYSPPFEGDACDSCAKYEVGLYVLTADYGGQQDPTHYGVKTLQLCYRCFKKLTPLVRPEAASAAKAAVVNGAPDA